MLRKADAPIMDIQGQAILMSAYCGLPSRNLRWHSERGRDFLLLLESMVDRYGVTQCAQALQCTSSGIHYMLSRSIPRNPISTPHPEDVRELQAAWRFVVDLRAKGQRVTRSTPCYARVHSALQDLRQYYTLVAIASVARIPTQDLKLFECLPIAIQVRNAAEAGLLLDLRGEWIRLRRNRFGNVCDPVNQERFVRHLADAVLRISPHRIAVALNIEPERVLRILGDMGKSGEL